jgi:hypothetical protein
VDCVDRIRHVTQQTRFIVRVVARLKQHLQVVGKCRGIDCWLHGDG